MAEENTYSILNSNFIELAEKTPVKIPKIQRDYAQGRENEVAKEIRTGFIHDLIQAIKHGERKELDFVYGSYENGAFEPLDGQQRLTTLFLLHWYFGFTLFTKDEVGKIIPFISYETRTSAEDFCRELVQHNPKQFQDTVNNFSNEKKFKIKAAEDRVNEAKGKIRNLTQHVDCALIKESQKELEAAKAELSEAKCIPDISIATLIKNRDWFSYLWKFDPTIQSMLVMIDTIHEEVTDSEINIDELKTNLNNITFSNLNLGDFGLSDELFIKMNARGKLLSSFDILKSTLEEEIQIQKEEDRCSLETEASWRSMIDGQWIDWFWNLFAANEINEITEAEKDYKTRLSLAKLAEENLKRLILRIISLQILNNEEEWDNLMKACYNDDADKLEGLMSIYNDKFRSLRLKNDYAQICHEIKFSEIIEDISCLYFKKADGSYCSIFNLISKKYNITPTEDKDCLTFLLDETVPNDRRIIFYALLRYIRLNSIPKDSEPDQAWIENLNEWAHFCRNIFLNDNNNSRIDKPARFIEALNGVNSIIEDLQLYLNASANGTKDNQQVRKFIAQINNTFNGIDNSSLKEEIKKASLKLSNSLWTTVIDDAEGTPYLWGQIRCLISWADDDINKFKSYSSKLAEIFELTDHNIFYAGILSIDPSFGFSRGTFCEFNQDRDNSIKRYLRDGNNEGYAPSIKAALDVWIQNYPTLTAQEFFEKSIEDKLLVEKRTCLRCLISMPSIFDEASNKMVFKNNNGHYILAQKKRIYSHCYDIVLDYIYYKIEKDDSYNNLLFFDSVAETYQHAISFEKDNEKVLIIQTENGGYRITRGEATEEFSNETELLDYMYTNYSID